MPAHDRRPGGGPAAGDPPLARARARSRWVHSGEPHAPSAGAGRAPAFRSFRRVGGPGWSRRRGPGPGLGPGPTTATIAAAERKEGGGLGFGAGRNRLGDV